MSLPLGYHKAKIMTTAVARGTGNSWIEFELVTDSGEQVLTKLYLSERAMPWTKGKLEKLGFKGSLAELAGNRSNLTGKKVDLRVKDSKSQKNDGTYWPEYEIYPERSGASAPARELPDGEIPTSGRLTEDQLAALEDEMGGFNWGVN